MTDNSPIERSFLYLMPFASLIWLILGLIEKRKNKLKNILHGRPGIPSPISFLNPRNRWVYSLSCAAQSTLWLQLLFLTLHVSVDVNQYANSILKALYLIVLVMTVSVITYPMVACVNCPLPLVGYILGSTYCLSFFGVSLYEFIRAVMLINELNVGSSYIYGLVIVSVLPRMICIFGINVWYIYKLIKLSKQSHDNGLKFLKAFLQSKPTSEKNLKYVRNLLKNKSSFRAELPRNKLYWVWHCIKKIDLPLPLSISASVSVVIILQLTIVGAFLYPRIFGVTSSTTDNKPFRDSVQAIAVLGPVSSGTLLIGLLLHQLYTVQKTIKLTRQGKGPMVQFVHENMSSLKLTASVRFVGYQTASFITGWIFYTSIITSLLYLFVLVCYYARVFGFIIYLIVLTGFVTGIIILIQIIICKFLFFTVPDNKQKATLVINNRRSFESFTFFTLLYSVATGLFTSTTRILIAIILIVLVKPRLDRIVFIAPFQKFDSGHGMYRGFIITEALLNNPVMKCFVELLMKSSFSEQGHSRARMRWYLAYTLIRNPKLVDSRVRQRQTPPHMVTDDSDDGDESPSQHTTLQDRAHQMFSTAYQLFKNEA